MREFVGKKAEFEYEETTVDGYVIESITSKEDKKATFSAIKTVNGRERKINIVFH
jgi:hypothetical protein